MSANKLELIESVEVTSSTATVTLGGANWNNTYDSYMVILDGVTNDSADEIQMTIRFCKCRNYFYYIQLFISKIYTRYIRNNCKEHKHR